MKAWGIRLLQEEAERNGSSFSINGEDRINAHNDFFREEAVTSIREAAETDPSLKPFARLADNILRLQPQIYTRTADDSTGIRKLCTSQRGGAQGNATTNIIYPAAMNNALKSVEQSCNVIIRAIQDDATTVGKTSEIFGYNKGSKRTTELSPCSLRKPHSSREVGRLLSPAC